MTKTLTIAVVREATIARSCTEPAQHPSAEQQEDQSDQERSDLGTFQRRTCRTSKRVNDRRAELSKRDLRVWPQPIGCRAITRSSEITHGPNTRPLHAIIRNRKIHEGGGSHISLGVRVGSRECNRDLKVPAAKAELIPTLQHTALVWKPMRLLVLHLDPESTISGSNLSRVVPLLIPSSPVAKVDSFPVGIITRVEGAAIGIEFVREDENVLFAIPSGPCLGVLGSVVVNQGGHLEGLGWLD